MSDCYGTAGRRNSLVCKNREKAQHTTIANQIYSYFTGHTFCSTNWHLYQDGSTQLDTHATWAMEVVVCAGVPGPIETAVVATPKEIKKLVFLICDFNGSSPFMSIAMLLVSPR